MTKTLSNVLLCCIPEWGRLLGTVKLMMPRSLRGCCSQILPPGGACAMTWVFCSLPLWCCFNCFYTLTLKPQCKDDLLVLSLLLCSCLILCGDFPVHFCLLSHCLFISWFSLTFSFPFSPSASMFPKAPKSLCVTFLLSHISSSPLSINILSKKSRKG